MLKLVKEPATSSDGEGDSLSDFIQFVIEDADDWSTVASVSLLRRTGLNDVEKTLVEEVFKEGPNPDDLETVEGLIGRPFEHREVNDMLTTCIDDGDYVGALGFARLLNITLSPEQIELLHENAQGAEEPEDDD